MIAKRPSIFVYTNQPGTNYVKEICAGIEEEGVFFEVFEKEAADAKELAFEAARDSMPGAGIGVTRGEMVLQMRGLKPDAPVESCLLPTDKECRKIGSNSARLIKRMALK